MILNRDGPELKYSKRSEDATKGRRDSKYRYGVDNYCTSTYRWHIFRVALSN